MSTAQKTLITVTATVTAPVKKVWYYWNEPIHITLWNTATPEWHTPTASNDLRVGGKLLSRMEARDGSMGFDFEGVYSEIIENKRIVYTIADGRSVEIDFKEEGNTTTITETFEAEQTHPAEFQKSGWQAILDNFKRYIEAHMSMEPMHFKVLINAPVEKVYATMLEKKTYEEWTKPFNASSKYEGSWEKGAKILFLGTEKTGEVGGMVARIAENIPNKFVSIQHRGLFQKGEEITSGKEVEGWAGITENYTFKKQGSSTLVEVDVDTNKEFKEYFINTWPLALNILKEISEK